MTKLHDQLTEARKRGHGVLGGFLPSAFPTPKVFVESSQAAFNAGISLLEVSMPGPTPALDGQLIRMAAHVASHSIRTVDEALELAGRARVDHDDLIIALAYKRTTEEFGLYEFVSAVARHGLDGYLVPELPLVDQLDLGIWARKLGIEPVLFLYRQEDLTVLARSALEDPVIYLQSADLSTGSAFNYTKAAERLNELAEAMGGIPYRVIVGFGVRAPEHVKFVLEMGADGAVVGTRLVDAAAEGAAAVHSLITDLVGPTQNLAR